MGDERVRSTAPVSCTSWVLLFVASRAGPGGAAPAAASGFAVTDQGARAQGLGGAFTGLADDASAVFYNPGGLALMEGGGAAGGVTLVRLNESLFQGLPPGPGAGANGQQDTHLEPLPYVYVVKPLKPAIKLGIGLTSPFHFSNSWQGADTFPGRTISLKSDLTTYDATTVVSFRLGSKAGFGIGAVLRTSELSETHRVQLFNPLADAAVDVAEVRFDTDTENQLGWTAGFLHRVSPAFSWGISYRSAIATDYTGTGRLTQVPTGDAQFDDLVAVSLPLDQDLALTSSLELPDTATLGLAFGLGKSLRVVTDVQWTGWSSVDRLAFQLTEEPTFDQIFELRLDDTVSFRAGVELTLPSGLQLRLGAAMEDTAQPDETVGPLLADSDRTVLSGGLGLDWLQVVFSYTELADRTTRTNVDGLNGTYRTNFWSLSVTISP
jgi:long-chain fatty acid transport protein